MPAIANAAIMHLFYETLEEIPTYKDGKFINIKPLTEADSFKFPGFKDTYVCYIGHPEPVTLPRLLKVKSVSNFMYMGKGVTDIVRKYAQRIINKEISVSEASIKFYEELRYRPRDSEIIKEYIGMPPGLSVIAIGTKDGKRKKIAIANEKVPAGGMAGVTGVPLAIALEMLINGEITEKGVLTPEEVFTDPMNFLDRYAKYCGKNLSGEDVLIIREVYL
jgi:saccharopine dehydrogenase (NAD+, L-lysine-forming)